MTVTRAMLEASLSSVEAEVDDPLAGLYRPDSLSWRINREVGLFVGGGRAALLQLAHPFVASAVDEHSATRTDVAGRFRRTFENVYAMSFGTLDDAFRAARRVHRIHSHIVGTLPEDVGVYTRGQRYEANDPDAQLWVHATLVDSALQSYELLFGRLSDRDRDCYVEESVRFAQLFALSPDRVPRTHAAFSRYFQSMVSSHRIAVGTAGRSMARFLLAPPTIAHLPVSRFYRALTTWLLPERLRAAFGLRFGRRDRALAIAGFAAFKRSYRLLPPRLRHVPAYIEAGRRVRGQEPRDRIGRALERVALRTMGGSTAGPP